MLTFTLAISYLTSSNLPCFMDLTFQVSLQYCSLQHRILLLSPVTSTPGCCFCFDSISSFFLELFLHSHRKLTKLITWTTALSSSMKLWAMPRRASQDRQIMVESSTKCGSLEKGMANNFSILALKPLEQYEKAKRQEINYKLTRSVEAQYVNCRSVEI